MYMLGERYERGNGRRLAAFGPCMRRVFLGGGASIITRCGASADEA